MFFCAQTNSGNKGVGETAKPKVEAVNEKKSETEPKVAKETKITKTETQLVDKSVNSLVKGEEVHH